MGGVILSGCISFAFTCFWVFFDQVPLSIPQMRSEREAVSHALLSLQQPNQSQRWEIPALEDEVLFFLGLPFPGSERTLAHVQIKKSGSMRSVAIPARIYLSFSDSGNLEFQEKEGPFWIDLSLTDTNTLLAQTTVIFEEEKVQVSFVKSAEPPPIQRAEEFPVASALRLLGDVRWRGADLLMQFVSQTAVQRVEIGSQMFSLSQEEFLVYREGSWMKVQDARYRNDLKSWEFGKESAQISYSGASDIVQAQGASEDKEFAAETTQQKTNFLNHFGIQKPLARIRLISSHQLEWDVWDEEGVYRRLSSSLQTIQMLAPKPEELINSLRIRSQNQISCMLERQSFLLKVGDWVLKEQGRWHIIRTPEEREKILSGQRVGELFILEKIEPKRKMVKSRLFFPHRTQMVPMELASRKEGDTDLSQKRKKAR